MSVARYYPCSGQSDTRNCSNRLTFLFSFPFSKADSSSAVYTTEREYTTSHISTQTSPASPTTSTRDIVTVSVQYNVSTTDLETSHARWVCQFPVSRGDVENDRVTRNRTCTLWCVFPVTRRIRYLYFIIVNCIFCRDRVFFLFFFFFFSLSFIQCS